ncbi:MAG: hypothetical protein JST04_11730 [Bdellovibrionales bacterium]|nr:hypothetical protein [Bdellovibrionales bacterium]
MASFFRIHRLVPVCFTRVAFSNLGSAVASIDQAPPSFPFANGEVVYVDFQKASYHIVYDFAAKTATVDTEIEFEAPKSGYPLFDLVPEPRNARLDDQDVEVAQIADPDSASKFRVLRTSVAPGSHRLTLSHTLEKNVDFRSNGVASAFWMSDLTDRRYLEQYLPTNFEYDQYPMTIRLEITGAAGKPHVLRANGVVKNPSENVFEVEFPAFYTTSSMFFHLSPAGSIASRSFILKSVDGRDLPVEVYTNGDMSAYVAGTKRVIAELEADYGPFPHPKVIVYGAGMGGMEYSGATMTSPTAVGHELFHSYNARGVMPARGNAGWIDEAMSSFRDRKYATRSGPGGTTRMAGHSVFTRMTDDDAYGKGADFMGWIAGRMNAAGKDFKTFLRGYFHANFYHTMTTEMLKRAMEAYSGFDLDADFDTYIYGKTTKAAPGSVWGVTSASPTCGGKPEAPKPLVENPFHPRLTEAQERALL